VLFACWYLAVYGVGRLIVSLIQPEGVQALLVTSVALMAVTVPLSFIGGRYIFRLDTATAPHEGEGT
jgi:prolipoprotein diacylglyceryltransferase